MKNLFVAVIAASAMLALTACDPDSGAGEIGEINQGLLTKAPNPDAPPQPAPSTGGCKVTGCSGQICADQVVYTTCEWRPQYQCYQEHGRCGRFGPGGTCAWEPTSDLIACLEEDFD